MKANIKKSQGEFNHSTLKGSTAERVARDFLRNYFPPEYGFGNGQIIDSDGRCSDEIDIAICNPSHPFTYIREGRGIFFIETTDAVIEVKSTIDNIEGLTKHCESVRQLKAEPAYGGNILSLHANDRIDRTPYAVFAFGSDFKPETIIEKLEKLQGEESNFIDMIYVVDAFLIHYRRPELEAFEHFKAQHSEDEGGYVINKIVPDLLVFLLLLSDKMPNVNDPSHPMAAYLSPEGYEELT